MPITIKEKKFLIGTFIFFLLLRLLLSVWPWYDSAISGTDLSTYRQWSVQLAKGNLSNFYQTAQFFPYPPLSNYFFLVLGILSKIFYQPINSLLMTILFKLPNILGEIGVSIILFVVARNMATFKQAYFLMVFYLIQPASIFITSIWGQWDGLMVFFLVVSFYCLSLKKITSGFVLLVFAILTKPQALPFLVPLAIFGLEKGGYRKFLIGAVLSLTVLLMLFYPFFPRDPFWGPYLYFKSNLSSFSPRFTSSGFNLWYLLYGGWQDVFPALFGISLRLWTRILTVGFIFICTFLIYFKKTLSQQVLAIGLSGYTFFLFFTQVKERYFYGVLPFLVLGLLLSKNKISIIVAVIASLLFAFNTIGFYIGWVGFGLWNSTFLSYLYLDKIISVLYILIYLYVFLVILKPLKIPAHKLKSIK